MSKLFVTFSVSVALLAGVALWSTSSKSFAAKDDGFRCEESRDIKLPELKLKLLEHCNLDKPYSVSASHAVGIEKQYLYCCHKKR